MRRIKDESRSGWVCLHRSALYDGWIKNHKLWILWTYCLLKASHKERKVFIGNQRIDIKPGQFIFGLKKASEETGLSIQSTRSFLNFLKKMKNLTINSTNKFSVITINNWELYQGKDIDSNKQSNMCLTSNQQTSNNRQQYKQRNNKKKCRKDSDPRVKTLIDYFRNLILQEKEYELEINYGAAGKLLKKRLSNSMTEDDIKELMKYYIDSEKANKNGISLTACLSAHTINLFKKEKQKRSWLDR